MDEHLTISTPEQVAFHYETAGIGSRFIASLLDHLILTLTLMLVQCAIMALVPALAIGSLVSEEASAGAYFVVAIVLIIYFLIFWGYFVLFETVWNGQTPGKRAGRLRVIRRNGQPIGAGEAMIRNLVRLVDFLPGFYGVGLVSMFIDKDARRLGDFAAGTIVVREGQETSLRDVRVPTYSQSPYGAVSSTQYPYSTTDSIRNAQRAPESAIRNRYDPLPGISLREVTADDYRLARELLARVNRGELPYSRGQQLASQLAYGIASRIGHDFGEWQRQGWEPLVFLQSVLEAKDARE